MATEMARARLELDAANTVFAKETVGMADAGSTRGGTHRHQDGTGRRD